MKKWLIVGLLLLLVLVRTESTGTDISQLEPVAAIQILTEEEGVHVITDTGSQGYGENLKLALENLHGSAPAEIFLDTVQYLIVDQEKYLKEMSEQLRPACQICLANGPVDLELAAGYLKVHGLKVTLLQYRAGTGEAPLLYSKEGRSQIVP